MTREKAAAIVAEGVGLHGMWGPTAVDRLAREAAQARAHGDWGADCGWVLQPSLAAERITLYLDSFMEDLD